LKLQERLTFFTVSLTVTISTLLGGLLVQENYRSSLAVIDVDLMRVVAAVNSTESDKVTTALIVARDGATPIAIFLASKGEEPISLEGAPGVDDAFNWRELPDQSGKILERDSTRFAFIPLEGDSSLLLAASSAKAEGDRRDNFVLLFLILILIVLLSLYVLRKVISRDVERERIAIESQEKLRIESAHRASLLEFAGDASHELRTPLTVLKGYLELAQQNGVRLNDPKILELLLKETGRMDKTVTQLLDLYSIENGSTQDPSTINLSLVLREQLEVLARLDAGRPIDAKIEGDLKIRIDEELLMRVLGNIFMNVHRHTQQCDAVEVVLSRDLGKVRIEVHDSGPGIVDADGEFSSQVFRRFDRSRSRSTGGSGLGLSIIDASVSKLGGKLEISRSRLGGTLVVVELPDSSEV
jgi:two-component system OmpR family sensor kinase